MLSGEEALASRRQVCRNALLARRVLENRFPGADDPVMEWLPDRPDWSLELPDVDVLERELSRLRQRGGKVVLYGHDDMDGMTGLFIGRRILQDQGFRVVPMYPRRSTEEYGLLPERMEEVLEPNDLLLTVDYGCSSVSGVKWAVDRGARVVITDHHTLHYPLPPAHGMVNPQKVGPPASYLAGCAVLYAALVSVYPRWENHPELLTAVAVGTVSDRVPMLGWNRYLLEMFMQVRLDRLSGGLAVMAEEWPARRRAWTGAMVRHAITSVVGKGEASGIQVMLDFMEDRSYKRCRKIWKRLTRQSKRRAHLLSEIFSRAIRERDDQASAYGMNLVYLDHIPDGMGGTLASRLSRITHRGTIIVSSREKGKLVGEARSFGDWDMADFLVSMGDVFTSAGGHKMAAGFSCQGLSWSQLRELLLSRMSEYPVDPVPKPHVDLVVDELPDPAEFLCLAPFGGGFLPPAVKKNNMRYLLNVGENVASWFITEESGD
ncbi:MAG: DHH family phosphoesterase [Candidatus Aegiribacteria sp.]